MLDIKALEKALSVIGKLGKGELTFTVDDVPVTLRVLTADEDLAVQRFARGQADETEGDVHGDTLNVLERYKRATLGFAIVQVGSVDLRDVDFVATGEMTDKDVPVKMPKHLAVRKIVDGWTRTASLALFQKYNELIQQVDAKADLQVKFNPTDLDVEITRIEKRLEDLKKERDKMLLLKGSGATSAVASMVSADTSSQNNAKILAERVVGRTVQPNPSPAVPANPQPEVTISAKEKQDPPYVEVPPPTSPSPAAPAAARQRVMPAEAPPPPRPVEPPRQAPREEPQGDGFGDVMDSLGDSPEAIAAETARIQAARMAARKASMDAIRSDNSDVLPGVPTRRVPPHRAAAQVDAVVDFEGGGIEAARPASGPVEGVETYRLGTATVTDRGRPNPNTRVPVDPKPKTGSNNPRFKPPGR